MIRLSRAVLAALAAALLMAALPQAAGAACTHSASAYDRGGIPVVGVVNDPLFPHQWGLRQVKAPGAWGRGARGAGITIAIVDSGVDLSHPDLKAKLVAGKDLVRAAAGLTGPGCAGPQDENGHGTHVAGIAAAATNNGIGVSGTAPAARIMPVRVLDANGGGEETAVNAGIRWAADHGAKVINLSLGGDTPIVGNLPASAGDTEKAVAYAFSRGAVVVGAAGNESLPLCDYPAASQDAVCVAATDSNGLPAAYSNFPANPGGTVAVRAPGGMGSVFCESDVDIWSTMWPDSPDDCGTIRGYETLSGTSMAAPFVSGVAALLAGRGLTASQILECLKTHSSNNGSYDPVYGYGIVNADAAVAGCARATTPPFSGAAVGHGGGPKHHVHVVVKRTTRKALERTGRLHVSVKADRRMTVKLRANVRFRGHSKKGAGRTLKLARAGTRKITLTLSRKARHELSAHRRATVQVRYSAGREAGTASTAR
jgi:subtilisin family serine protease